MNNYRRVKEDLERKFPDTFGLSQVELSRYLKYSPQYLANMRSREVGPPFIKVKRKVFYPVNSLANWIAENLEETI